MNLELEKIKKVVVPILQQNGVEFAGVFGSVARGEDKPDSDVDLMVRFTFEKHKTLGLFQFIGLQNKIATALERKIDMVEEDNVHPYVEPYVLKDLIILYGKKLPNIHRSHIGRYRHYPRVRQGLEVQGV